MRKPIQTFDLPGRVPFPEAYARMTARRNSIERGQNDNALFLLEHTPVITLGRDAKHEHIVCTSAQLDAAGIAVVPTDRGGGVTYHGPGQLVAYPVLDLKQWRCAVRWYLRMLEQVLIDQLAGYGLTGERIDGLTGVWVEGAKVAAVGIGVHRWVTFHGIALNVDPNLAHFGCIIPCGIPDRPVTSLRKLLGHAPPMAIIRHHFETHFRRHFDT